MKKLNCKWTSTTDMEQGIKLEGHVIVQVCKDILKIHRRLSSNLSSWSEYDLMFIKEVSKIQDRGKNYEKIK